MGTLLLLSLLPLPGVHTDAQEASPAWREVILVHMTRYPEMEVDDLYKLLHQGSTGSEHAVPSVDAARRWLVEELESLGSGPSEPLADTIAPAGAFLRIHLRPFVAAGGDPEVLLEAFVRTADAPPTAPVDLRRALDAAVAMAEEGLLPWDPHDLTSRFSALEAQAFPAVHHSQAFSSRYRPAYRVVSGQLLADVLPGSGLPGGRPPG